MSSINWTFPYPSQRMPVFARNVVATTQPLAAQAGLQVMQQGGNAVDAAVATAAAMTVLEPNNNGLGADAFALVWHGGKVHGVNGSGRAPKALTPEKFAGLKEMPKLGWDPVTVPGAISAWVALSQKFGKLPFEKLLEPAVAYAEGGFQVAPRTAAGWATAVTKYKDFPEWQKTFAPKGRAPQPGEVFANPDQGKSLRRIAETKGEAFYRGELAERIAAAAKAGGALMTTEDFASHSADWVEPIFVDYRGLRLYEIPPNGQGITALMALGMLREYSLGTMDADCPDVLHAGIEAMKLAFADSKRYVADPKVMEVTPAQLLDRGYLASRAKLIDTSKARDPQHGGPPRGGTILLCAADAGGTMVTLIQSNYEGFGSAVVVPGTGIHLQNRGACFVLAKGHPNEVGGGKRPYHTIIPAMVTRPAWPADFAIEQDIGTVKDPERVREQPVMAYGVMGGFMQPQGHLQVLTRFADFSQNPQAALDAPRWQVKEGLKVIMEPGHPEATYEELRRRGHDLEVMKEKQAVFGYGQAILKLEGGYAGASDGRGDGQAVGY